MNSIEILNEVITADAEISEMFNKIMQHDVSEIRVMQQEHDRMKAIAERFKNIPLILATYTERVTKAIEIAQTEDSE